MRRRLRACLAGFCFAVFGVGSFVFGLSLVPLLVLLPEIRRRRIACALNRFAWRVFVALMSALRLLRTKISREDAEILRRSRGAIVVANHPTLIDVLFLVCATARPICFVKGALLDNVFVRRVVDIVHLPGSLPAATLFEKAETLLACGFNIVIFPEGTRTVPGKKSKFHRGAANLSLRTGAPILPVKISAEPQVLGKHQKWWQVGDRCVSFTLRVLPPILPKDFAGTAASAVRAGATEKTGVRAAGTGRVATFFHNPAKRMTARIEEILCVSGAEAES